MSEKQTFNPDESGISLEPQNIQTAEQAFRFPDEEGMSIEIVNKESYKKAIQELKEMGPEEYQRRCLELAPKIMEIIAKSVDAEGNLLEPDGKTISCRKTDYFGEMKPYHRPSNVEQMKVIFTEYATNVKDIKKNYTPLTTFPEGQTEVIIFNMHHHVKQKPKKGVEDSTVLYTGDREQKLTLGYYEGAEDIAILGKSDDESGFRVFKSSRYLALHSALPPEDRAFYDLIKTKHRIEAGLFGDLQKLKKEVNEIGIDPDNPQIFREEPSETE